MTKFQIGQTANDRTFLLKWNTVIPLNDVCDVYNL